MSKLVDRQEVSSAEELVLQAQQAAKKALTRPQKLDHFFRLATAGADIVSALKESNILEHDRLGYDPSNPNDQIAMEELFYARCICTLPTKAEIEAQVRESGQAISPQQRQEEELRIVADEHYDPDKHLRNVGWLTTNELFKLVDWLYFVRAMPLKALSQSIRVPLDIVISVKSELSNESAKAIRRQSADGYIADLSRTKDLIRQDLISRRSKLTGGNQQAAATQIDKLLWQLENDYVDRLQEIGIIDKTLGKLEVHEEWSVTIGTAGQPINEKLKRLDQSELPAFLKDDVGTSYQRSPSTIETTATPFQEQNIQDMAVARELAEANRKEKAERVAANDNPEEIRRRAREAAENNKTAGGPESSDPISTSQPNGHDNGERREPRAAAVPSANEPILPDSVIMQVGGDSNKE